MTPEQIRDILEDARSAGVLEKDLEGMEKKWPQDADRQQAVSSTVDAKVRKAREAGASEEDIARVLDKNPQARERNNVGTADSPSGYVNPLYQEPTHVDKDVPVGDDLFADLAGTATLAELEEVEVQSQRVKPSSDLLQEVEPQGTRVTPSNDLLQEVEPQGTRVEPVEPNQDLLQEVEVSATRAPNLGGEPQTESGKWRQELESLIPHRAEGTYKVNTAPPGWWESVGWNIQDYGMAANIKRMVDQARDEHDPEGTAQIQLNMPELTYGVSEEYHDHIAGMPNMAAAEREADRLRTQEFRDKLRQNESAWQALSTGFVGFVGDPINLVPGATIVKGMTLSAKLSTAAGLRGAAATTVGKRAEVWAYAGLGEELIRNAPRLESDATYKIDGYLTDASLGLAFGAGMPLVGAGARIGARQIPKAFDEVVKTGEAYGVDVAVRNAAYTVSKVAEQVKAADGSMVEKFKAVDLSKAAKDAKIKTAEVIEAQLREIRDFDIGPAVREAVEGTDAAKVTEAASGYLTKIMKAIRDRDTTEYKTVKYTTPTGEEVSVKVPTNKPIEYETRKYTTPTGEIVDVKVPKTPRAEKAPEDLGAAQRKTTPQDKVGDAVHDLRETAKQAKREVEEVATRARAAMDEAELSEDVRKNLEFMIERVRQQSEEAIDLALTKKGYRPTRKNLNNKDHTENVGAALLAARQAASTAFDRVGSTLTDVMPKGFTMKSRGNFAMSKAMQAGGVVRKAGENFEQAWTRTMKGKSHTQRAAALARITDEFNNQVEGIKYSLDAAPYLDAKQVNLIVRELDEATQAVNQQLDLASVLARNPFEDAVVTKAEWSQISEAWRDTGNMPELARQFNESKTQSAVKHQFGKLTESLASRLIKSEAPLAQWFTYHVLETPAGFGGKLDRNPLTAAIYAENLDAQARRPVLDAWETMMRETAKAEGWPWLKRVFNKQGNAKTHSDVTRISKEVQLEMNARHFGTQSNASPAVKKFAAVLDAEYQKLHDLQNGHVAGIHDGNKIQGYQHQVWDDQKILDLLGNDQGRKGITDLFRQGYLQAGLPIDKATILAKAMIDQKVAAAARPRGTEYNFGDEQLKGMMPVLTDVVDRMRKNGTSEEIIVEIVEHINKAGKGDTPGYAKSRVPIDLNAQATINGQTISVVDIMDNDVPSIFTRYSKESTARRAISESTGGVLDSDRAMHDMMVNMALEAQELGALVDTRAVRNALAIMMGKQYDGQLPMDVRRARDAVSLAGMGGLGESQLAEFGLAVNRGIAGMVGAMQKFRVAGANVNKKWRGIELTPEQASDRQFLSELQEVSGLFGDMHLIDRRNVHFDAQEKNYKGLSGVVDTMTGGKHRPLLQHMQTRFTGYGAIRQFEDQIAMASIVQDIAKKFSGRKAFSTDERLRDLGVDLSEGGWLAKKFRDTVTYKDDGTVEQLNLNQWSDLDRNKFGVILNRYASQQVQKGFVGESSPEMMNPWVSFLMQFKSYPMLAAEKQQARHLKFADKEAAMGVMLNAASSGAARAIRYHSLAAALPEEKREDYLNKKFGNDFAHDTLMYMGGVGMMVNNYDLVGDLAGNGSVADQVPILNYMDNYIKAARGPLDGDLDDRDMRNIQVAQPLGTIAQSNILYGIIRNMMHDE